MTSKEVIAELNRLKEERMNRRMCTIHYGKCSNLMEETMKAEEKMADDQFKEVMTHGVVESVEVMNTVVKQIDYIADDIKHLLKEMHKVRHDEGRTWTKKYPKRHNKQPNGPTGR